MPAISDFDPSGLEGLISQWGFKSSHARTILRALYREDGPVFPHHSSLGRMLWEKLSGNVQAMQTTVAGEHCSADGTIKLLVGLADGQAVEAVLMPGFRSDRAAGCISSQVGCAMGCDFCASARGGLKRNLTAGEIVEQFLHLRRRARLLGRRLASLVFMGMGEPLHNLASVLPAIQRIAHRRMGNLGWRHITVSTVGIVPGIDALAAAENPVYLAVSLHAPDDATRGRIVATNRRWPVAEVLEAARRYQSSTGRIVNIEYCLLAGVNDSLEQASLLAKLMRGFPAHVNLIPHNPIGPGISGVEYHRPDPPRVERFAEVLRQRGVVTHIRIARGDDVAAACGQLRQTTMIPATTPRLEAAERCRDCVR
ncbi:MAG: 23S rRNA (adenine(2503)-C(2))-methyltransferase RlmN [Tepidisphaeraceae bacterium]